MKVNNFYEFQQHDTFYTGIQLRLGEAPEGIYQYASGEYHSSHANSYIPETRYIMLKTRRIPGHPVSAKPRRWCLLRFSGKEQELIPACPNDNTIFRKTTEQLQLCITSK